MSAKTGLGGGTVPETMPGRPQDPGSSVYHHTYQFETSIGCVLRAQQCGSWQDIAVGQGEEMKADIRSRIGCHKDSGGSVCHPQTCFEGRASRFSSCRVSYDHSRQSYHPSKGIWPKEEPQSRRHACFLTFMNACLVSLPTLVDRCSRHIRTSPPYPQVSL